MRKNQLLAISAMFIISGCGNIMPGPYTLTPPPYISADNGSKTNFFPDGTLDNDASFSCPFSPNILPSEQVGPHADVSFTACKSANPDNKGNILIHGKTLYSDRICVFPALDLGDENITFRKDLSKYNPNYRTYLSWSICPQVKQGSDGLIVDIPLIDSNKTFNALAITEVQYQSPFQLCSMLGLNTCASNVYYYYGKFR